MERLLIKSSAISEIGYDAATMTLEILFPSKALWRYKDVPIEEYEGILRAESAGHYFSVAIRAVYKSSRVHNDGKTHETKCGDETCFCAKLTKTSRETENKDAQEKPAKKQKKARPVI